MKKGSYILLFKLNREHRIRVGRLGVFRFPAGFYAYVGSAMNGLRARIERHERRVGDNKSFHWHVDYLREKAEWVDVLVFQSDERRECSISDKVSYKGRVIVEGFGSSDCDCSTHLWFFESNPLRWLRENIP